MTEVTVLVDGRGWQTWRQPHAHLLDLAAEYLADKHPSLSEWCSRKAEDPVGSTFDLRAFREPEQSVLEEALFELTSPDGRAMEGAPPKIRGSYQRLHQMLKAVRNGEPPESFNDLRRVLEEDHIWDYTVHYYDTD